MSKIDRSLTDTDGLSQFALSDDFQVSDTPAPAAAGPLDDAVIPPPASPPPPQANGAPNNDRSGIVFGESGPSFALTYKGVNYVGDIYGSFASANSLSSVVSTGGNAVAITADFGIDAQNNTVYQDDVDGGFTESNTDIGTAEADAVGDNLSVMARPLIDFLPANFDTDPGGTNARNGSYSASEFRAYYNPGAANSTGANDFFASYQSMIVAQAQLAQQNGATVFCIGTELDQLTGPSYETYWDNIITAVRDVFSGKLTYSALWDDSLSPWQYGPAGLSAGTGDITTQVSFWSKLDYVGIDEYAPISDLANPTVAQLVAGWTQTPTDATTLAVTGDQSLIDYYEGIASSVGKPLIFTELGYANSSDADSSPATPGYDEDGNPDGATADPTLQANLYQAFFQAWHQDGNNSVVGAYLWNWEPSGSGSDFSVQGLPAQTQVQDGFTACYAAGTRIATASGETAVEALVTGDLVRTASGDFRPVVWIGHRRLDCRHHRKPADVWPVRVQAHAFGPGLPRRDLVLSPDHAVHVRDVLIPVRYLLNGSTVAQCPADEITYYHVELPRHDIILAEGLPAESYLDTGNRGAFANGGPATVLHPDFAPEHHALDLWNTQACAPLVCHGAEVRAARQLLRRQAISAGYSITTDAAPYLRCDGRIVRPQIVGQRHRFQVPAQTRTVRLISRRAAPAWLNDDNTDHRPLGLAVARLSIDGRQIELAGLPADSGWHAMEPGWRWTDGDAAIDLAGGGLLDIEVVITAQYWLAPEQAQRARTITMPIR